MTEVTLVDHMGTDLSVVNAARVSFNKKSQWGHHVPGQGIFELKKGDIKQGLFSILLNTVIGLPLVMLHYHITSRHQSLLHGS